MASFSNLLILVLLAIFPVLCFTADSIVYKKGTKLTDDVTACRHVGNYSGVNNHGFKALIICRVKCPKHQIITEVDLKISNNVNHTVSGGLGDNKVIIEIYSKTGLPINVTLVVYATWSSHEGCDSNNKVTTFVQHLPNNNNSIVKPSISDFITYNSGITVADDVTACRHVENYENKNDRLFKSVISCWVRCPLHQKVTGVFLKIFNTAQLVITGGFGEQNVTVEMTREPGMTKNVTLEVFANRSPLEECNVESGVFRSEVQLP